MPTFQISHGPQHPCSSELARINALRDPEGLEVSDVLQVSRIVHVGAFGVWVVEPGQGNGPRPAERARRVYDRLGQEFPAVLRLIEEAVEAMPARRIEVEVRQEDYDEVAPVSSHRVLCLQDRVLAFLRGEDPGA